jgi:hypothetical protein
MPSVSPFFPLDHSRRRAGEFASRDVRDFRANEAVSSRAAREAAGAQLDQAAHGSDRWSPWREDGRNEAGDGRIWS